MRCHIACLGLMTLAASVATAQSIRVSPATVSVNSQDASTVFLSFSGVTDYVAAEAAFCTQLVRAEPALGQRCDPVSVIGRPRAASSAATAGGSAYTESVPVPAAVARAAYAAAASGASSGNFFYVRRFVATITGPRMPLYRPDQYVVVTLRLSGTGAGVPFALTDVALRTSPEAPIVFVRSGDRVPAVRAEIRYNGSGRLRGRWEVVLPGEAWPTARDLTPEASLSPQERAVPRRWTQVERFDVFLPPMGRYVLEGPDPRRLPTGVDGSYLMLLRIEASDDRESSTRVVSGGGAAGGGVTTVVRRGASASFPMPTLRYVVGSSRRDLSTVPRGVTLLLPRDGARLAREEAPTLTWRRVAAAARYRLDVRRAVNEASLYTAIVARDAVGYRLPPFVLDLTRDEAIQWRVTALTEDGRETVQSDWSTFRVLSASVVPPGSAPDR
ncbi:hypothetical protein BH11GEM1_BH11GEM1_27720 [soil metagenome]